MRKMKVWIGLAGIVLLASCAQKEKGGAENELVRINVDVSGKPEVYDIGNDVEEWEILALETTDNCLIAPSRVYLKNDLYYFLDISSSVISVFNREGKFVSKLDKKGGGPDDYIQILACTVAGRNVWVAGGVDLICYDENWHAIDRQRLTTLPVYDMAEMDGCIYLAQNWDGANCQLIEYDPESKRQNCLMPLPKYSPQEKQHKMIKQTQLALWEDGCLFIQSYCDTIFRISNRQAAPQYRFVFSERYEDIPLPMEEVIKPTDKIRGLLCIYTTPRSIILPFLDQMKMEQRYAVYNEKQAACRVYAKFGFAALGNLTSPESCRFTHDGEMIWIYSQPEELAAMIDESKIASEADRQKIHSVLSNIKEGDNPVLFRFKLKEDAGL
jgi:hypothetical protein